MNDLEDDLTRMPEPDPPPGLAAVINARIAQADTVRATAALGRAAEAEAARTTPAVGRAADADADAARATAAVGRAAEAGPAMAWRDRLAWALALVGMAVGLAAQAYRMAIGEAGFNLLAPRVGGPTEATLQMFPVSPPVAALALGLALYLAGLVAPRHTERSG